MSIAEFRRNVFERAIRHESRGSSYHQGIVTEMDLGDLRSVHRFVRKCVSGKSGHKGENLRALDDITFAGGGQVR